MTPERRWRRRAWLRIQAGHDLGLRPMYAVVVVSSKSLYGEGRSGLASALGSLQMGGISGGAVSARRAGSYRVSMEWLAARKRSARRVFRWATRLLRTAMAMARRSPTRTTISRARVTAV